jgi:hypothetical protein
MWSSGAAGGRIPASSPSFLAGEAVGKDHMLTRTRLVAGVGGGSLAGERARRRPTVVAVGARAPAKGWCGRDNTRHREVL